MKGFKLGEVEIKGRLVLGPMAGVTDMPFRLLCKEQGVALTYTEMVSAKGMLHNNKNTEELITIDETERPTALQLFGEDAEIMGAMARKLTEEGRNFDILDVNMGCPVPKVVNHGEGSALMKEPKKIGKIVESLKKNTTKPVSIKIRAGFDKDSINAVEVAKIAEAAGVDMIAVHGRTREEFYSGKADWNIIRAVKEAVSVPVIGSGDVNSPETAKKMLDETGVDGIMIARASMGNPWIFKRINAYIEEGVLLPPPDNDEMRKVILRQAKMMIDFKGEYTAIREMRKHLSWYSIGKPNSAKLRGMSNKIEDYESLKKVVESYFC